MLTGREGGVEGGEEDGRGRVGGKERGGRRLREREGKRGVLVRTELLLLQLCVEDVLLSASPRRMEALEPDLLSLMEYLPAAEELGSKLAGMERWVWVGHVSAGLAVSMGNLLLRVCIFDPLPYPPFPPPSPPHLIPYPTGPSVRSWRVLLASFSRTVPSSHDYRHRRKN